MNDKKNALANTDVIDAEGFAMFPVDGTYRKGLFFTSEGKKYFAYAGGPAAPHPSASLVVRTVRVQRSGITLGTTTVEMPAAEIAALLKHANIEAE